MSAQHTPVEDAIAKRVADRCSEFKSDGQPKAPQRYSIIYQAARLGAIDANKNSAAPELLDALEAVRKVMFDGILNSDGSDVDAAIEKMCAAIAKARGEKA